MTTSNAISANAIRAILKNWQNTKEIGELSVAQFAFVEEYLYENGYENTAAARGLATQKLLGQAMDELWPTNPHYTLADDPKRLRMIIRGQFIEGLKPDYLQEELGLSRAQYFEKQRQALDLLAAKLAEWDAQCLPKRHLLPVEDYSPPDVSAFVGRQAELAYYGQKLAELHYVVITGFPGVGKTTLAAKLVREIAQPEHIFWYQCRPSDGVDAILWALAKFLQGHKHPELWRNLHGAGGAEKSAIPLAIRIDLAVHLLSKNGYWVCLDDFQAHSADPGIQHLAEKLYAATQKVQLQLMMTARQMPTFLRQIFEPLTGLTSQDAQTFLAAQGVHLSTAQFEQLYAQIDGHSFMLTLAADLLKRTDNPDHLIEQLAEAAEIEHFLLDAVDQQLAADERALMGCIALLGTEGRGRNVIETVLDGGSVLQTLRQLSRRNLLTVQLTDDGQVYSQHATLRSFYYARLGLREQRAMHGRAANYYQSNAQPVHAASHYLAAGDMVNAIALATHNVRALLHQGHAGQLRTVLEQLNRPSLDTAHWISVQIALGQLYTFTQEDTKAQACFAAVLARLAQQPLAGSMAICQYEAYRGLGYLLRSSQPATALTWLDQGLHELTSGDPRWLADLWIQKGIVLRRMKHGDEALAALQTGVAYLQSPLLAEPDPVVDRLALLGWMNLGVSHYFRGELASSEEFLEKALRQAIQLNDKFNELGVQNNLAVLHQLNGRWPVALASYQKAIKLATTLGNQTDQIHATINLGILYRQTGDQRQAAAHLDKALTLARQNQKHDQIITALAYRAEIQLFQEDKAAALALLAEAEELAVQRRIELQLPLIYRLRALYHLAVGNLPDALAAAEKSLAAITQSGMKTEAGPGLRVLGRVQAALGNDAAATQSFAESLQQVAGLPYEEALTQAAWGEYLVACHHQEWGRELLKAAHTTFARLGAAYDLREVTALIEAISKG